MHSLDVSQADFDQQVIEASRQVPVIVDFWAPWCGPCRSLKPILEKLADEYAGKFILAKINSDENQALAQRYGVRGIPHVKAFVDGEAVDEFSGALPEGAVREFIDRLVPSATDELRRQAQELAGSGDTQGALGLLAQASQLEPHNAQVRIDAAALLIDLGNADEARQLLDSLDPLAREDERARALAARIQFEAGAGEAGDAAELEARIAADGGDLDARLKLAKLRVAGRQYAAAFEQLLEIVRRDRAFGDDAGRKTMLSLFSLLDDQPELVRKYRSLLASALN